MREEYHRIHVHTNTHTQARNGGYNKPSQRGLEGRGIKTRNLAGGEYSLCFQRRDGSLSPEEMKMEEKDANATRFEGKTNAPVRASVIQEQQESERLEECDHSAAASDRNNLERETQILIC